MPANFCESCGVRVVAPGKCKACGGDADEFKEPEEAQVKPEKKAK